ncbi:hypothetical protein PR048_028457 [Dryococelus australis]|uniref:Uncharacterized protein n=1 Tax=Dryococelus australis TaxID=614101 RepID=A0ABQ9GAP7_9NEOP|nr:hypothetical protein PR048_028457 [Dryococelus australis]
MRLPLFWTQLCQIRDGGIALVAFTSRLLSDTVIKFSTRGKVALECLHGIKNFVSYLDSRDFVLYTRLWIAMVAFMMRYFKSSEDIVSDTLSRIRVLARISPQSCTCFDFTAVVYFSDFTAVVYLLGFHRSRVLAWISPQSCTCSDFTAVVYLLGFHRSRCLWSVRDAKHEETNNCVVWDGERAVVVADPIQQQHARREAGVYKVAANTHDTRQLEKGPEALQANIQHHRAGAEDTH